MDGIMDETLTPIIERGSQCVVFGDINIVPESDEEPWKIIFLACIVFKTIWILSGVIHQRILLNDDEGL